MKNPNGPSSDELDSSLDESLGKYEQSRSDKVNETSDLSFFMRRNCFTIQSSDELVDSSESERCALERGRDLSLLGEPTGVNWRLPVEAEECILFVGLRTLADLLSDGVASRGVTGEHTKWIKRAYVPQAQILDGAIRLLCDLDKVATVPTD